MDCIPDSQQTADALDAIELFGPNVPENEVRRVVRAVLRWAALQDGHHSEKRTTDRFTYLSNVVIGLPDVDRSGFTDPEAPMRVCYGWTRNLSSSGVGVVLASTLAPQVVSDGGVILHTSRVLPKDAACTILFFDRSLQPKCLLAKVARSRELHASLVEIGFQFLAKLDGTEHPVVELLLAAAEQFSTRLGWLQAPPSDLIEIKPN
jgi:hypothetical protein